MGWKLLEQEAAAGRDEREGRREAAARPVVIIRDLGFPCELLSLSHGCTQNHLGCVQIRIPGPTSGDPGLIGLRYHIGINISQSSLSDSF